MAKLTLDDIADLRAYERERDDFRQEIIALKKRRRIALGPVVTVLFENRDTIRFQIQEMARAERILTDEGIQTELDIYNPLVPDPGRLAATLFIELTSDDQLREWLPKLVGIETALEFHLGPEGHVVRCQVDPDHERQLTREDTTASVHYIHFSLRCGRGGAVRDGPGAAGGRPPGLRLRDPARPRDHCRSCWPTCGADPSPADRASAPGVPADGIMASHAGFAAPAGLGTLRQNPTAEEPMWCNPPEPVKS